MQFLQDNIGLVILVLTGALEVVLRKWPGAKPLLQRGADALKAADNIVDQIPGLKNK